MAIKQKKRSEIKEQFQWSITDLMASDTLWQQEYDTIIKEIPLFAKYKKTLHEGAQHLLSCLQERDRLSEWVGRIYVYAQLKLSEDSTNAKYQGFADLSETMLVAFYASASFIESEILAIGKTGLDEFMAALPELQAYSHYISDILRQSAHILSPDMEELLTKTQEIAGAPENIYAMLNNADMKFGFIEENGQEVELTQGNFTSFMESTDRNLRKAAFQQFYEQYINKKNTLATTYSASVKGDVFYAKERKYKSALDAALFPNNIPINVYENLLKTVEKHLPKMHKYMDIRKKALGIDELHMYDIYTPMVLKADTAISYDNARETVIQSLAPLGKDYVDTVKKGFETGWVDVYENEGKRSGAFSWGAYGCHPYVLLNYDDKVDSMFTLAHEMGHAMHSHYTWGSQPYIYGDYTIFVAEVASTVNEALLMDHLLKTTKDETMTKYLINYYMEQFRGTLFRQTMFAEFEMITHKMAEEGEPLTSESLNALYRKLNEKYYGSGIVIDNEIDYEWSRIPHFYTAFYVYQYATGHSAAIALSQKILTEGESAVERYINFLKGGSSDYSINLLKKAGVDMSTPDPIDNALEVFGGLVNKFQQFL